MRVWVSALRRLLRVSTDKYKVLEKNASTSLCIIPTVCDINGWSLICSKHQICPIMNHGNSYLRALPCLWLASLESQVLVIIYVFCFTDFKSRKHLDGEDFAPEQARVVCFLHPAADGPAPVWQRHHYDHLCCLFPSENNAGDWIFMILLSDPVKILLWGFWEWLDRGVGT